jgi:hypothetical protein
MNCVEFRRHLGADPQSNAVEFVRHRAECPRCADAAGRAVEFDRNLLRALNIEAPAQLADSILLAQATDERRRRVTLRRRGTIFAVAASLALAIGLFGMRVDAKPLSTLAVDHLSAEPFALATTAPIPDTDVRNAFAKRGVALDKVPAGVSYVQCCPVGRYLSVHMVMPEQDGPVTVLYVTNDIAKQRQDFVRGGWLGRSVPMGHGTLVLLAKSSSTFDHVEAVWSEAFATAPANGRG